MSPKQSGTGDDGTRLGGPGRPVRVIHKVNQKLVTTECRSVRDSNVTGFIELIGVANSTLKETVGEAALPGEIESLVLPKIVVVAISYPRPEGGDRVVLLHPAEEEGEGPEPPEPPGEPDGFE